MFLLRKEITIENGEDRRPASDADDCVEDESDDVTDMIFDQQSGVDRRPASDADDGDAMEDESDDVTDAVFVGWVR